MKPSRRCLESPIDALRVTAKAHESAPVEFFRFTIDPQSATGAAVTLAWGREVGVFRRGT